MLLQAACSNGPTPVAGDAPPAADTEVFMGETEVVPGDTFVACLTHADCEESFPDKGPCQVALCDSVEQTCVLGDVKDYSPCLDDDECTLETYCLSGACGNGFSLVCDDGNPCTDDACDTAKGCVFAPNTAPCDDGSQCTADDACESGVCTGAPSDCPCQSDADCLAFGTGSACSVQTMACVNQMCVATGEDTVVCDPSANTGCAKNTCDPETGECSVVHAPDGTPCSDGFTCTSGDACGSGACVPGPNMCACNAAAECAPLEDDNLCNGVLDCIEGLCSVVPDSVVVCPKQGLDSCQQSVCEPATGTCKTSAKPSGVPCDDEDLCTTADSCQSGTCSGDLVDCDDANPCTKDSCDPSSGCSHAPLSDTLCDDGDACTTGEICKDGVCGGSVWTCGDCGNSLCEDGESCTSCAEDCGPCPGCGDGQCDAEETCTSCPEDCGPCPGCGDGQCDGEETCTSCSEDCGPCPGCGDGQCDGEETCTSCSEDCGPCGADPCVATGEPGCGGCPAEECVCTTDSYCCEVAWDQWCVGSYLEYCGGQCEGSCGDGFCDPLGGEDCSVCIKDCGPCGTCGDQVCGDAETCGNCPADCGQCQGSCAPAATLACGASLSYSLTQPGVTDSVEAYSCNEFPYPGPEYTYAFEASCDGIATVTLSKETSATDVMVLSEEGAGCDPTECVAFGFSSASFDTDAGGTYYVVIDGYGGASGSYTLAISCQCGPVCGNSQCEPEEDCQSCPADCGACCGSSGCQPEYGEDCQSCPEDCGACPKKGSCCIVTGTPGCQEPKVEACVCALDPYCCQTAWDSICASEADECGSCSGDCCAAHGNPGCDDEAVEACVCGLDPYCCDYVWDSICASEVVSQGCGSCGGQDPVCGDGQCNGAEDSCSCPGDCPDDPNSCSACQCGQSGGNCWCDANCLNYGDCCGNACQQCGQCAPVCGDGKCNGAEDSCSCPGDCPDDPNSCSACQCGQSGGSCFCDAACFTYGDCCGNACQQCGACGPVCGDGQCNGGEDSCSCPGDCPDDPNSCSACQCGQSGGSCFCDAACATYGDCCGNACSACGVGCVPPGSSCAGNCGGMAPNGCWCDSSCTFFGDCCIDYQQHCG
jgi:hypothetical protein